MKLDIFSYNDLLDQSNTSVRKDIEFALLHKGILGIRDIPDYEKKARTYIDTARRFASLDENIKKQYAPDRDAGLTEGYELGAEQFKGEDGEWKVDDRKASYYAFVPDQARNKWPREMDLKTAYMDLGMLIYDTSKLLLDVMAINDSMGVNHDQLMGYGRMLHYHCYGQKKDTSPNSNPEWFGAHFDHGLFTGLVPAYYFRDGKEIDEPEEAGLCVIPTGGTEFEKVNVPDKSVLLFQVGEFGQLISNDRIKATKHIVKRANDEVERFTFALFTDPHYDIVINSRSQLTSDERYANNKSPDGSISYLKWQDATYEQHRAKQTTY